MNIECDWTINHACNLSCDYCVGVKKKTNNLFSPQEIMRAFEKTGILWKIHITGGEPMMYKNFFQLCRLLTKKYTISINTNLTLPVKKFNSVNPSRVSFIHVSLHYKERKKITKDLFLSLSEKIHFLQNHRFKVILSQVINPSTYNLYEIIFKKCLKNNLILHPKFDKNYNFSASEIDKFLIFASRADALEKIDISRFCVDLSSKSQGKQLKYIHDTSIKCSAGKNFVTIDPLFNISRCNGTQLGNLIKGNFHPLKNIIPCSQKPYCLSFCLKYSKPNRL